MSREIETVIASNEAQLKEAEKALDNMHANERRVRQMLSRLERGDDLREVLKADCVERIGMIEEDIRMLEACIDHATEQVAAQKSMLQKSRTGS